RIALARFLDAAVVDLGARQAALQFGERARRVVVEVRAPVDRALLGEVERRRDVVVGATRGCLGLQTHRGERGRVDRGAQARGRAGPCRLPAQERQLQAVEVLPGERVEIRVRAGFGERGGERARIAARFLQQTAQVVERGGVRG